MARPPGDWDKHTLIQEYDLDDSRATGWCLDITFGASDPLDGDREISFMLAGHSGYCNTREDGDTVDVIRHIYNESVAHGKVSKYRTVVGVLASPEASMDLVSKKLCVGTYLVIGDRAGKPIRIYRVPISHIVRSYVDFGT